MRTRGEPDRLEAYTAAMLQEVARRRPGVEAYAAAVRRFNAMPNDVPLAIPDRSAQIHDDLDRLEEVDGQPAAFAAALRAADTSEPRDPGLRCAPRRSPADRMQLVVAVTRADDLVTGGGTIGRGVVNTTRVVRSTRRLHRARGHLGDAVGPRPHGALRRIEHDRRARRAAERLNRRRIRPVLPLHREAVANARSTREAWRAGRRLTGFSRRIQAAETPTTKALKVGSKALGLTGSVLSVGQATAAYGDGRTADGHSNLAAAAGGLLLVAGGPVTMTIGAGLVVGALIYDHREHRAVQSVKNGVRSAMGRARRLLPFGGGD